MHAIVVTAARKHSLDPHAVERYAVTSRNACGRVKPLL